MSRCRLKLVLLVLAMPWGSTFVLKAQEVSGSDPFDWQLSTIPTAGRSQALPPPIEAGPPNTRLSTLQTAASNENRQQGAWWTPLMERRQRTTQQALRVSLNSLLVGALAHSAQIQVISDTPLISETAITAADAAFDWTSFLETRWDDISEPVGNTLTTGGPDRLQDHILSYEMGVRRRNMIGGELEIGQQFGHQNNNSIYFIPQDQGTARLTLSYTQPLLRGAGRVYNTSLTVLASIDASIAQDEFSRQLQTHLLEVTRAYWTLYYERGTLIQKQRSLERASEVLAELESRRDVDALQSQIVRARSAVESRRADLVRAKLAIRNAEARIRALVNDPALGDTISTELLPKETLSEDPFPVDLPQSVALALRQRPEIEQAVKHVKAACVRMNMSKRELLPLMNVVLESHVAGLEGNSSIGGAFKEQFTEGEPSYSIGLQYEYPIWNREASARVQRRRLEVRRLQNQFRATVENLKLEVEVAVHDVTAAYEGLHAKNRAMEAAAVEVDYLGERWRLLPVENGSASLMLEDLLDAQDRLADAEQEALTSALAYNLAQVEYKQAVGSLLEYHGIASERGCDCDLPYQRVFQTRESTSESPRPPTTAERFPSARPRPSTFDAPASRAAPITVPEVPSGGDILPLTRLPSSYVEIPRR